MQVVLARQLGPELFGVFGAGLAILMLLTPLASFGTGPYWLKVFGQEGWQGMRWISPSLRLVTTGTLLSFTGFVAWVQWGPNNLPGKAMLFLMAFHLVSQVAVELVSSKLQLEERFKALSLWQLSHHGLRLCLVLLLLPFIDAEHAWLVGLAYAVTGILLLSVAAGQLNDMRRGRFALQGHREEDAADVTELIAIREVARKAWPFGMAALAYLVYFQSDVALVKHLIGEETAGYYNVSFTIMAAVYLTPSVIFERFLLPKIHRWAHQDRAKMRSVYRMGNHAMFWAGCTVALLIWLLSDWGVVLVFGEGYQASIAYLKVFCFSVPAMFVSFCAGALLASGNTAKMKVYAMMIVAVFNVVSNLIFIPLYGALAAAWTTVASQFLLALLFMLLVRTFIFPSTAPGLPLASGE
ncbi:oligosaccharide flippase family protein [Halomonas piscis]|uniref:Oligosaccharide flippase family protein n=1 Tax=Halomonas piscis TaxID=3031727 RepID=A0ABY9Z237_9GAMM|nr:oligosaccharide flippase family protein [Halomonas piscis]WNK21197.1 oligosaccharide flippase family protein [Halomonas piscis]